MFTSTTGGAAARPAKFSNGIDLEIEAGEFVSIVGQTGCGKSTLLRLMLAEEKPTQRPRPGGRRANARSPTALRLRPAEIFAVPRQDRARQHHLRPGGNRVRGFSAPVARWTPRARASSARKPSSICAASDCTRRTPASIRTSLSGGMQQRVAIAQALIMKPRDSAHGRSFQRARSGNALRNAAADQRTLERKRNHHRLRHAQHARSCVPGARG